LLKDNDRKVLYIGDCEVGGPGDDIEANTRRYIEEHAARTFTSETWIKVALTIEQVNRSPRLRQLAPRAPPSSNTMSEIISSRLRVGSGAVKMACSVSQHVASSSLRQVALVEITWFFLATCAT
jgi:hypothetical protein